MSTKSKAVVTPVANPQDVGTFRLIGRGVNAKGQYKRHAFIVRGTYAQAWAEMQQRYEDVTKGFKPETVFINVYEGKHGSGYRHDPVEVVAA